MGYASPYLERTRDEYLFRYKPGTTISWQGKEFNYERTVSELGFTDHWIPKDSIDYINILAIGDSYTEGIGAGYNESWPRRLENLLEKENQDYMVYNGGISGSDPFFDFQNLKFLSPIACPNIVIELINRSDFSDVCLRGRMDRFQNDGTVYYKMDAPWWEALYKWSHTIRAIIHSPHFFSMNKKVFAEGTQGVLEALDSSKLYIEQIHGIFVPVFLPIPINRKVTLSHEESLFVKSLKNKYGTRFLDLTETVCEHAGPEYFWELDSHCTALGYEVLAEAIQRHLERNIFPKLDHSQSTLQ